MSHNSGGDHFGAAAEARMIDSQNRARNRNQRADALAAAERAVKDAAMAWWKGEYVSWIDDWQVRFNFEAREKLQIACAALAALEAK